MRRDEVQTLGLPSGEIFPNFASQIRVAFSNMDAKTGCKIAGGATDNLEHLRRLRSAAPAPPSGLWCADAVR